jgi:hypothetical protein
LVNGGWGRRGEAVNAKPAEVVVECGVGDGVQLTIGILSSVGVEERELVERMGRGDRRMRRGEERRGEAGEERIRSRPLGSVVLCVGVGNRPGHGEPAGIKCCANAELTMDWALGGHWAEEARKTKAKARKKRGRAKRFKI